MFISSTGDMRPVQLDQIESVEEHAGIMPALSDTTERAALTRHRLTIDNAGPQDRSRAIASTISEKRSRSARCRGVGYIRESAACASTHTLGGWVVACSWPRWASTILLDASACRLSSRISASRSLSAASIAS